MEQLGRDVRVPERRRDGGRPVGHRKRPGGRRRGGRPRVRVESRRARAVPANVCRSGLGHGGVGRQPAAGLLRGAPARRSRRRHRCAGRQGAAAARRGRRALRPPVAVSSAGGRGRHSRHRAGARHPAGRRGCADGRQRRPARAVCPARRARHHAAGRRAAGVHPRAVRHGRHAPGRSGRHGRAAGARRGVFSRCGPAIWCRWPRPSTCRPFASCPWSCACGWSWAGWRSAAWAGWWPRSGGARLFTQS